MVFGKKKRIDDEESDREEDQFDEEEPGQELPEVPARKEKPKNVITKEQIGFMIEGHIGEMIRLWNLYKQLRN